MTIFHAALHRLAKGGFGRRPAFLIAVCVCEEGRRVGIIFLYIFLFTVLAVIHRHQFSNIVSGQMWYKRILMMVERGREEKEVKGGAYYMDLCAYEHKANVVAIVEEMSFSRTTFCRK